MSQNEIKLENWYEPMKEYKPLSLKEAKMLSKKRMTTTDEIEKKKLADELILGTMHVLYAQLKSSYFLYFPSKEMDIEDIINTAVEVWIKYILEGNLVNLSFYSDFFRMAFYKKVFEVLGNFTFYHYFGCSKEKIIDLLISYIEFRQEKDNFSLEELTFLFKEIPNWTLHYPLFENVYNYLNLFFEKEKIAKRKLKFLLPYLIEQSLLPTYNPKDKKEEAVNLSETMEEVEKRILIARVNTLYNEIKLPSLRNKQIFSDFLRLYDYPNKTQYIAKLYNISKEKVEWIEKDIYKKIRRKKDSTIEELESIYEELAR